MILFIYRCLTRFLYIPYRSIILKWRVSKGKEDPVRYQERLGYSPYGRLSWVDKLIWIHGASVGESLSLIPLIDALVKQYPHHQILMTSGTKTSADLMAIRLPESVIHQYAPLEFTPCINRFLNHWKPDLGIWVESELWPNQIFKAHKRGIPLVLVNMRLSQKSLEKWLLIPLFFKRLFSCFNIVFTQTQKLKTDLESLHFSNVHFSGNLKNALAKPALDFDFIASLENALGNKKPWMAASTHKREEQLILATHKALKKKHKNAFLILAPRHPERTSDILKLCAPLNLSVTLYSTWIKDKKPFKSDVFFIDVMGVIAPLFHVSQLVFIGGSLIPNIGGHNIFEPLLQEKLTLHGPHMQNFSEAVVEAQEANASICVQDQKELEQTLFSFYDVPESITSYEKNAKIFMAEQNKIVPSIMSALKPYLETKNGLETKKVKI